MANPTEFKLTIDRRALDGLSNAVRSNLGRAVAKIARDIEANAKATVVVDTGFLKNSIEAVPSEGASFTWYVNVGAHYGVYIELGTVHMSARPFLSPAVERMRPVLAEVVRQAVDRAAREAGGR